MQLSGHIAQYKYNLNFKLMMRGIFHNTQKFINITLSRYFHLFKMSAVSEAAKGWSNPGISNIYEKTRPNYNLDSVEFLLEKVGALEPHSNAKPYTIVELGAGTGKFTRAMLKVFEKRGVTNFKIIATEPLKEMCEKFQEMVPNVEILQYAASDLSGLANNCADSILAAQCFHWFGMDQKALHEIHRILIAKGIFGIIWNLPDRSLSWIKTIEEMLDAKFDYIYKIPRPDNPVMFVPLRNHGGFGNEGSDLTSYKYRMELDFEGIIERYKGNSVVAAASDEEKERILLAIEREMKTNSLTKDKQKYVYEFAIQMHWFQKI